MNVEQYLQNHQNWAGILKELRAIILDFSLQETIKWGSPVYCFKNTNLIGLAAFKNHAAIWFFRGDLLNDSQNKLEKAQEKTKYLRQWRFTEQYITHEEKAILRSYIQDMIDKIKQNSVPKSTKSNPTSIPASPELPVELAQALKDDNDLLKAFQNLPPYKQKEFITHIVEAKRDATRLKRLIKCIPMIKQGNGLNDKYRK